MMEPTRLVLFLLLVSPLVFLVCASLERGKVYHIRTEGNSFPGDAKYSYLRVAIGGDGCNNLGPVGTVSNLNTTSIAFRWRYNATVSSHSLLVEWDAKNFNDLGYIHNELSRYPHADHFCSNNFRVLNVTQVLGNKYRIQDVNSRRCLVAHGINTRASWNNCTFLPRRVEWEFIEAK